MGNKSKHNNKQAQQKAPDPWPQKIIIGYDGDRQVRLLATVPATMNILLARTLLDAIRQELEKRITNIASQIPAASPEPVVPVVLELPEDPEEAEEPAETPPCEPQEGA